VAPAGALLPRPFRLKLARAPPSSKPTSRKQDYKAVGRSLYKDTGITDAGDAQEPLLRIATSLRKVGKRARGPPPPATRLPRHTRATLPCS